MEEVIMVGEGSLLEVDLLQEDITIVAKDLLNHNQNLKPMLTIIEDTMEVVVLLEEAE